MKIELAFGRSGMAFTVPDGVEPTVIRKIPMPLLDNPSQVIADALDAPISLPRLEEAAKEAKTACILICDITRPVPNGLFLRQIIDRLTIAGVPLSGITVLIATGLHRPNLGEELKELVDDPWVVENVKVINHYARNDEDIVMLGKTPVKNTPVGINRHFLNADIRIATGLVEPHFMAGYSGGRKVVAPGVAHHTTIRTFHSARFMEDPNATSCNLDNNPLHDEQLEIIKMIGGDIYALNTVLDEDRNLVFANFGEIIESHLATVDFVRDSIAIKVPRKFPTIVTSAAGYPLDKTYYQTVKGMVTPMDILAEGGTIVIVAECAEGFGSPEFRTAQEKLVALGPEAFLDTLLEKQLADVDEWQTEMQLKPMRIGRIFLVAPKLSAEDRAITGVTCFDDLETAVAQAVSDAGNPSVAIVPEGPYVVPLYQAA